MLIVLLWFFNGKGWKLRKLTLQMKFWAHFWKENAKNIPHLWIDCRNFACGTGKLKVSAGIRFSVIQFVVHAHHWNRKLVYYILKHCKGCLIFFVKIKFPSIFQVSLTSVNIVELDSNIGCRFPVAHQISFDADTLLCSDPDISWSQIQQSHNSNYKAYLC